MTKTIVLSSGGTGGHVFPALSLAAELQDRGYQVIMMTDHRGRVFQEAAGIAKVISLPIWRSRGRFGPVVQFMGLAVSFLVALGHIIRLRPLAIMGFGGYPSLPAVLAGIVLRLPTALHEQNAILGRANRFLARFVRRIATSFQEVQFTEALKGKIVQTGNPVRKEIIAVRSLPYHPPQPQSPFHVLVIGGSQGAKIFSSVIPQALWGLPEDIRQRLVVHQQCRKELLDITKEAYHQSGITVDIQPFFKDMGPHLAEAHLVIGRAGASTVAELTVSGRPAILVPFAASLDNDQQANALWVEQNGGARMILERDFTATNLKDALLDIMTKKSALKTMAKKMHALGQPDAAANLAQVLGGVDGL